LAPSKPIGSAYAHAVELNAKQPITVKNQTLVLIHHLRLTPNTKGDTNLQI
jgi:hypothetical protein